MGSTWLIAENVQTTLNLDILRGWTPVKTEPEILRSFQELIAVNVQTQLMLSQVLNRGMDRAAGGQLQGGAFLGKGMRADEGSAYDDSAEQVRLLSQRVEELERRLNEGSTSKAASGSNK